MSKEVILLNEEKRQNRDGAPAGARTARISASGLQRMCSHHGWRATLGKPRLHLFAARVSTCPAPMRTLLVCPCAHGPTSSSRPSKRIPDRAISRPRPPTEDARDGSLPIPHPEQLRFRLAAS